MECRSELRGSQSAVSDGAKKILKNYKLHIVHEVLNGSIMRRQAFKTVGRANMVHQKTK